MKVLKNIEQIMLLIFTVFVSLIILTALFFNIQKFQKPDIAKYAQIRIEEPAGIEQIAQSYAQPELKDRFIEETTKINSLRAQDYVANCTLIIPIFE